MSWPRPHTRLTRRGAFFALAIIGSLSALLLDTPAAPPSAALAARVTATVAALADFDEPATYHLSSVGWLRHHLGWKADSSSDEEPG